MDTTGLSKLGLNNSEIKTYLALLELESSSVGPIIEKAAVPDSKIYIILEKLKEKGLVSFVIKNNVKHFQASDPENIIYLLDEKAKEIEVQKEKIKKELIPEIKRRRKLTEDKQESTVYEGIKGLRAAFNYVLSTMEKGEEYYVFTLGEEYAQKNAIYFFQDYHKKRVAKGVKIKSISEPEGKEIIKKYHNYKLMKYKVANQKVPIGTVIFKGHILIVSWQEKPTAFIIKSKQAYQYYKAFFEEIWEQAKP
jgi:HTH-type transcriptional regulator, sugar sensing transcriptional regulator